MINHETLMSDDNVLEDFVKQESDQNDDEWGLGCGEVSKHLI